MARRGLDLLGIKERKIGSGAKILWDDRQLSLDLRKQMGTRLKEDAELVAQLARENVNEGKITRAATKWKSWKGRTPGSLRKSIRVKKSKFKDGGYVILVGGYDTYYWFFVEYGTSKMGPQRFMRTALHFAKWRIRSRYSKAA